MSYVCDVCGFIAEQLSKENSFIRYGKEHCLVCGAELHKRDLDATQRQELKKSHHWFMAWLMGIEPLTWIVIFVIAILVVFCTKQ